MAEEQRRAPPLRYSRWESLNPEILALIFVLVVPVDEMVRSVPFVCRSWREAVAGPYCWSHIDIEPWCRRVARTDAIDGVVRRLSRRSNGCLRSLSAFRLGNNGLFYACSAASGKLLRVLRIPMSDVTNQMLEKHIDSLAMLTELDISNCLKITSKCIETLGKHCKALVQLKRNMPPPLPMTCTDNGVAAKIDESEAMAVANTMPGLKHLELAFGLFSDVGLDAILTKCKSLEVLDIRGCWNVRLESSIEDKCFLIQSFRDPWHDDYEDETETEDDDAGVEVVDVSDDDNDAGVEVVDVSDDD